MRRLCLVSLSLTAMLSAASVWATPAGPALVELVPDGGTAPLDSLVRVYSTNGTASAVSLVDSGGNTLTLSKVFDIAGEASTDGYLHHNLQAFALPAGISPGTYSLRVGGFGNYYDLALSLELVTPEAQTLEGQPSLVSMARETQEFGRFCDEPRGCTNGVVATFEWQLPASPGEGWVALVYDKEAHILGGFQSLEATPGETFSTSFYVSQNDEIDQICPTLEIQDPQGRVQASLTADCVSTQPGPISGCGCHSTEADSWAGGSASLILLLGLLKLRRTRRGA